MSFQDAQCLVVSAENLLFRTPSRAHRRALFGRQFPSLSRVPFPQNGHRLGLPHGTRRTDDPSVWVVGPPQPRCGGPRSDCVFFLFVPSCNPFHASYDICYTTTRNGINISSESTFPPSLRPAVPGGTLLSVSPAGSGTDTEGDPSDIIQLGGWRQIRPFGRDGRRLGDHRSSRRGRTRRIPQRGGLYL